MSYGRKPLSAQSTVLCTPRDIIIQKGGPSIKINLHFSFPSDLSWYSVGETRGRTTIGVLDWCPRGTRVVQEPTRQCVVRTPTHRWFGRSRHDKHYQGLPSLPFAGGYPVVPIYLRRVVAATHSGSWALEWSHYNPPSSVLLPVSVRH